MKLEIEIILHLNKEESDILKKLLGGLTGHDHARLGLTPEEAQKASEIWGQLPHPEEEE